MSNDRRDIVVFAASNGGLDALRKVLAGFGPETNAAFLLTQHIGRHPSSLPHLIARWCHMPASFAEQGGAIQPGHIYVAPPDLHMMVHERRFVLSRGPKENYARPAADPMLRSAAICYGRRVIGVVLSGDLDDGAAGLRAVRAYGGLAIVQDPDDALAESMPRSALAMAGADLVLPAPRIGTAIRDALLEELGASSAPTTIPEIEAEARIARTGQCTSALLDTLGNRSALTCPECGGALWTLASHLGWPRFRCHTGHAFTHATLASEQIDQLEASLWQAIRMLEERAILARERLSRVPNHVNAESRARDETDVRRNEALAQTLRSFLAESAAAQQSPDLGPDSGSQAAQQPGAAAHLAEKAETGPRADQAASSGR